MELNYYPSDLLYKNFNTLAHVADFEAGVEPGDVAEGGRPAGDVDVVLWGVPQREGELEPLCTWVCRWGEHRGVECMTHACACIITHASVLRLSGNEQMLCFMMTTPAMLYDQMEEILKMLDQRPYFLSPLGVPQSRDIALTVLAKCGLKSLMVVLFGPPPPPPSCTNCLPPPPPSLSLPSSDEPTLDPWPAGAAGKESCCLPHWPTPS